MLLDSGACPFLLSIKTLEQTCPGLVIDPISKNDKLNQLTAANGSPIEWIGSVDLHFRFSGASLVKDQSGKWTMSGPVMEY